MILPLCAAPAGSGGPLSMPNVLDIGAQRLGDPQAVEGEQRDHCVLPRVPQAGDHERAPDLVAIKSHGVRLHVDARTATWTPGDIAINPSSPAYL